MSASRLEMDGMTEAGFERVRETFETNSLGPGAFGHPGAGGSLALADPEAGIAFGYVMNQMKLGTTGGESLVEARLRMPLARSSPDQ